MRFLKLKKNVRHLNLHSYNPNSKISTEVHRYAEDNIKNIYLIIYLVIFFYHF